MGDKKREEREIVSRNCEAQLSLPDYVMNTGDQAKFLRDAFCSGVVKPISEVLWDMDISPSTFRETLDMVPEFRDAVESHRQIQLMDLEGRLGQAAAIAADTAGENPQHLNSAVAAYKALKQWGGMPNSGMNPKRLEEAGRKMQNRDNMGRLSPSEEESEDEYIEGESWMASAEGMLESGDFDGEEEA